MGYLQNLIAHHAKNLRESISPDHRIDNNLPLGLRIGTSIVFEDMPFILAQGAGLLVEQPGVQTIEAYGRIDLDEDTVLHRFYLNGCARFVQIDTARMVDEPTAIRLYEKRDEIMPTSPREWSTWLPKNPDDVDERYLIGFKQFDLREGDKLLASYARLWPSTNLDQVEPERLTEKFYVGATAAPIAVHHKAMLYGRTPEKTGSAEPPSEWALLSASTYPGQAMVQIHIGIVLEPRHLTAAQLKAA